MHYRVRGLPHAAFAPLFGRSPADLARVGVQRAIADTAPGFPCRITLEDAQPGEAVLLLNYLHQPANTPYRSAHAIFVREAAQNTAVFIDEVPPALRVRPLSVRAFDVDDMMVDADLCDGVNFEEVIERLFVNGAVSYLHAHYAKRGCYAARVDRCTD